MGYLKCILGCFEVVSGLKINLAKSKMYQVGKDCDITSLTWILGCKIGCLPSTYLSFFMNNKEYIYIYKGGKGKHTKQPTCYKKQHNSEGKLYQQSDKESLSNIEDCPTLHLAILSAKEFWFLRT